MAFIVPGIIAFTAIFALFKKTDVYSALLAGCADGIKVVFSIIPSTVAMLISVYMLRASGALDMAARLFAPITSLLGIPAECAPMGIIRPFSGGAALAAGTELIAAHGPDSYIGRMASVMLGSAETTFYTIAVYFGAVGIRKTRHAVPAALAADIAGYVGSAIAVRLLF